MPSAYRTWENILVEKFGDFAGICLCFILQLYPFILSCSYTSNSFVHILSSNWFELAHLPIFYPTKIFPRTVYQIKWVLIRVRICCLCAHLSKVSAGVFKYSFVCPLKVSFYFYKYTTFNFLKHFISPVHWGINVAGWGK